MGTVWATLLAEWVGCMDGGMWEQSEKKGDVVKARKLAYVVANKGKMISV